jgi:8-oxo-dGTP pyrophosphatase MutT (NUDIX family)
MAIYVDDLFKAESKNPQAFRVGERNGHQWCHFFSDRHSLNQLHQTAEAIGMKRAWFDDRDGDIGHYDLTPSKRALAIQLGATEVTRAEAVTIWRTNRVEYAYSKYLTQRPDLVKLGAVATVGIIPYSKAGGQLRVFLSYRHGTPRLKNLWGAAGGWVEPGEDILIAAQREFTEEGGLTVHLSRLTLMGFYPGATDEDPPRHYITTSFGVEGNGGERLEHPEPHKHGEWTPFTFEEALKLPLLPGFDQSLRDLHARISR